MVSVHFKENHIKKVKTSNMARNTQDAELLTVAEVARILRLNDTTVRRYVKQGALEAIKLPRRPGAEKESYRIKRVTLDKLLGN